ncbi:MAG: thioredoxin [Pseudomonadota bacterium]
MIFNLGGKGGQDDGADAGSASGDLIKDIDTAQFEDDVLRASMDVPVIVDFWAPWCGPCKTLTPILEKAVTAARGAVRLVKINIDENQALAGQMGIQSIPTVAAFKGGRPVDGFMGALPESQIKAFIERLAGEIGPSPADMLMEEARAAFAAEDFATAAQTFAAVLQEEPGNPEALGELARCYLAVGDAERAGEMLALVPPEARDHPSVKGAQAELDLSAQAADSDEVQALRAKIAQAPSDKPARLELAAALAADGQREEAMDLLLALVEEDRAWNDEAARKQLLSLFEALGPTHDLTKQGRRRLSSILFS